MNDPMPAPVAESAQIAPTIVGIDSIAVSGPQLFANAIDAMHLGQTPAFWGRYFHARGQLNAAGHKDSHYSAAEHGFLHNNNIRVLPIARQTALVGGSADLGDRHARTNVGALFETFPPGYLSGADPDVLVFLDVEQDSP